MQKILNESGGNLKIFYDIACKFKSHLQVCDYLFKICIEFIATGIVFQLKQRSDVLGRVEFAVTVFHGYGHTSSCQVRMLIILRK